MFDRSLISYCTFQVEKEQDVAVNPDKEEPIRPTSAKKTGTKLFIDPSLLAPKDKPEIKSNDNSSAVSPFKNIVPEAKSPEDIRKALSEVKAKRKSLGNSESDPHPKTPKTPTEREPFRYIPETHSNHSDPMQVEEDKEDNSAHSGFNVETSPFSFIPTPAVVLKRSGEDTMNNNNNALVEHREVVNNTNTNRPQPADHVDFFNNYTTADLPPKSPKNPFRELAEMEARAGSHTPIFGTDQDELSGSDRSSFTTQAPAITTSTDPFVPRVQQPVPVVKPINQSQPAKVLWNSGNTAETRVVETPFGQKPQVPARPTIQHRRISIMPSADNVVSTDFGIEQVDPTEEDQTVKIHLPKKQPHNFKALKTILGFLLLGLAVGALAYYVINFVEVNHLASVNVWSNLM